MEEAERIRKLEEELKMSPFELESRRRAEAEILKHENSKTAHYSRLGSTFVNRSMSSPGVVRSPLGGRGRGGR